MYKLVVLLVGFTMLFGVFASPALAQEGQPLGGCPNSFELHPVMDHDGHMHHHIGNDADQNGDGFLCMKHVGKDGKNHVHIDNNVPLD